MKANESRGLQFDDDGYCETLPFSSLDRHQRDLTQEREFYSLKTPWIAIAMNILVIVFFGTLFAEFDETGPGYNLIVVIYIVLWVVIAVINRFMHSIHVKARKKGYFKFYNSADPLIHVTFLVWCFGVAFIALLFVFVPAGQTKAGLYPSGFLRIFVGLQVIVITLATVWYCIFAFSHNKKRTLPDATEYLQNYEGNKSISDKQAEVIQHLEEKAQLLGKEVVSLYNQLEDQKAKASEFAKRDMLFELNKKDAEIAKLDGQCRSLEAQLEVLEQQKIDNLENKYAENHRELKSVKEKLTEALSDNNKLKLVYEVEKDALEEAKAEIELLKQALADDGRPVEEKTVYEREHE